MRITFDIEDSKADRILGILRGSRAARPEDLALLARQRLEEINARAMLMEQQGQASGYVNIDELENLILGLAGEKRTIDDINVRGVPVEQSFDLGQTWEPFNLYEIEKHFQAIAVAYLANPRLGWVWVRRLAPNGELQDWHWWVQPPFEVRAAAESKGGRYNFYYDPGTVALEGRLVNWEEDAG